MTIRPDVSKAFKAFQPSPQKSAPETATKGAGSPPSWQTWGFYGSQLVLALLILVWQVPHLGGNVSVLALFMAVNVAANFIKVEIYEATVISIGFVLTLAIIVLFGVPGVVIAAPVTGLAQSLARKNLNPGAILNACRLIIIYAVAGGVYSLFGSTIPESVDVKMVLGALLATGVSYALSLLFHMGANWLSKRQAPRQTWANSTWLAPHYLGLGIIGFALASAYLAIGIYGIFVFLTPGIMMRIAMKQYVDRTKDNVEKLQTQNVALQNANVEIQLMTKEISTAYDGTLEALVNALDARDQETRGHSIRVSKYMMDIAKEMGVREGTQTWVDMQRGSLLHDVGKIGITDNILLKPGKLTPEEWQIMRTHPSIGYNMLKQVPFLQGPCQIILAHHESWDGKGYPYGLAHEEIPFGARIFAVVDTFDSMTSDRPYRKALPAQTALEEILKFRGAQFDPTVVEAFLDIYPAWVKNHDALHRETEPPEDLSAAA